LVPVNRKQDLLDRPLVNGFNASGYAGAEMVNGKSGGNSRNNKAAKRAQLLWLARWWWWW
jgi:hypothetical protein